MFIGLGLCSPLAPLEGAEDNELFTARESLRSFERSRRRVALAAINISPLTRGENPYFLI